MMALLLEAPPLTYKYTGFLDVIFLVFYNSHWISNTFMASNRYFQPSADRSNQNLQNFMLMSAFLRKIDFSGDFVWILAS